MNDEAALPGRPASVNLNASEGSNTRRRAPALHLAIAFEELPIIRLVADTYEDEVRMRRWLASPAVRRRLFDAMLDGLDDLAA
jgi:hypothetical protein